mgnify:CR=1 FL=1
MTRDIFDAWTIPASVEVPGATSTALGPEFSVRSLSIESRWLNGLADILIEGSSSLRKRKAVDLAQILGIAGSRFLKEGDPFFHVDHIFFLSLMKPLLIRSLDRSEIFLIVS